MGTRHIGGSLLPSAEANTYKVKSGEYGVFQTRPLIEQDTHVLYFAKSEDDLGANEILVVEHPNGYSCDNLAGRIIKSWSDKNLDYPLAQFDYILRCGGSGAGRTVVQDIIEGRIEAVLSSSQAPSL